MKVRDSEFRWKIVGVVFLAFVIAVAVFSVYEKYDLKSNPRYTIGTTLNIWRDTKGNKSVHYEYFVHGKRYDSSTSIPMYHNLVVPYGRYFVVFSTKRNDNSEMLIDKHVANPALKSPPEGWLTLP